MGRRLTSQKMADVAVEAIPIALDKHPNLQVCIIGQGEKALEKALLELAPRYPGRCSVRIGFDEAQAHLLHAGADILLHGSRFEPFGLTPLYSMRYGTIRSEEHTSELQSLMRISYAVFCLKKKNTIHIHILYRTELH